ncbi:MAG: DNA topoisomerase I [Desulfurococcales archaeon]|nr:DNA topoisomerase I [Desulfurococcales archaeon]
MAGYRFYRRRTYGTGRKIRATPPGACYPDTPFIAVVAEKPKAGEKIASALGRPVKCRYMGVPYWSLIVDGSRVLVLPSAGHLFGIYTSRHGFPVYEYEWRPIHENEKGMSHLRKFYMLMKRFLPHASLYINACDYDIEGSVIGYTIIEAFGDTKRYKRMKFSSLSPSELRQAYRNLQPPDYNLVEAGKARHEVDWLWGINVSRALMHAVRRISGRRIILSAGRVQSPTLAEAARRWKEINLAVPIPEFQLSILCYYNNVEFKVHPHGWKPETRREASTITGNLRSSGFLESMGYSSSRATIRPVPAFNLGDLQKEAARLYGYSPMRTQSIAEDLYLDALISYPRTNSQKLPPTINYAAIISSLTKSPLHGPLASRLLRETGGSLKPVQGRKDDPAHPAIHPTGNIPSKPLDRDHQRIYDLVVRRFLAAFAAPAIVSHMRLRLRDNEGRPYYASGVSIEREGWYYYYPFLKPGEGEIPPIPAGERARVVQARFSTRWVRAAPSLSRTSLLRWMEAQNIGTEATRARIIEILFKRGYLKVQGKQTIVTDLGMNVVLILEELFPQLVRIETTRRLEHDLEKVRRGVKRRREVVDESKRILDSLFEEYEKNLERVGTRLAVALGFANPKVKCALCGREATATYQGTHLCRYHYEALNRLMQVLPVISRKLEVSEEEALRTVSTLRGSAGRWVVETAHFLTGKI